MRYSGGESLVDVLKRQKVKAIFCSPGSEWGPVFEALAKLHGQGTKEPAYFNCRHEELAVSAAIGYAQKGGELPAVLLHISSGLLHGAMAIRRAYMDQVPMIVFAGDSARFTDGEDLESGQGRGWQWLTRSDVGGSSRIAAPFVKWSQDITSRETLAGTIARACQIARRAPQGPVFMSVSYEYLIEEIEEVMHPMPTIQQNSAPAPADIDKIATLLMNSQNPIIITERVGLQPKAAQKLLELAETLAIPVFEAMTPYTVNFPREHPLHAGFNEDVTKVIREADVILVVAAIAPWSTQLTGPRPGASVLFIDSRAPYYHLPFWNYPADMIVAADPLLALEALVESVKAKKPVSTSLSERFDHWKAKHDQLVASWDKLPKEYQQKKPIDPRRVCHAINEWLPPEAIVVLETITHTPAITRLIRRIEPGNLYKTDLGGLGTGMGVALGVKLACVSQPVLHLVGDGSFNYAAVLSALGFSQEYHLPVLTIIFNNGSYRSMQSATLRKYPDGWAARTRTFYGVDIAPNPDYSILIKAFNGYGEKVEDPNDIVQALSRAWDEIQKGRSALLDVILESGG